MPSQYRRPLIAANWKMYKTRSEAVATAEKIMEILGDVDDVDALIAPSFIALAPLSDVLKNSGIALGAQNLHWEKEGAYTGEVSPVMLVSAGCTHVIIGHSERRQYFAETDEMINRKIRAAVDEGLTPIFCVGESYEQRQSQITLNILDKQVRKGLKDASFNDASSLIIAYEPVWAIGTGMTATKEQAQEVHSFLRGLIGDLYGDEFANSIRILYGGSVKPDNASELMAMPDIDGALVGGASLDAESFCKIVRFAA